jgi:uncharacterized protein (TIGR03435 family)
MYRLALVILASTVAAQPLAFEVASVKPSTSGSSGLSGGCHGIDSTYSVRQAATALPLGRCVIRAARLTHLISLAFGLRSLEYIKGGAGWTDLNGERFIIEAKSEDPEKATEAQLLRMLQALLVERFQLKYRRENMDMPGFAMVVARNGPKLREAQGDEVSMNFGDGKKPNPEERVSLRARKISMARLADFLTQMASGPVADRTGLTRDYDFDLSWDESAGPALTTALQQQLGLRLEPQKVPVLMFVIESAQKPVGN